LSQNYQYTQADISTIILSVYLVSTTVCIYVMNKNLKINALNPVLHNFPVEETKDGITM